MSTVLVVGASRGIGLAFVRHYQERGDRVVAACRTRSDVLGVEQIDGIDVTDDDAVRRLAAAAPDRIDILVHNAGILTRETLDRLDFHGIRRQMEVNALGPLRVTAALAPKLGVGSKVALMTSRMGSIADNTSGGAYGYRMSKAALNAAGVSLARDLAPRGIAVAILHPGYVRTDMTAGRGDVEPEAAVRRLAQRIDTLTLETSGRFWHADGSTIPW